MKAVLLGPVLIVLYFLRVWYARASLKKRLRALGCEQPPAVHSWLPFLGLDFLSARSRHTKSHNWLEFSKVYFSRPNLKTFQLNILNKSIIYTIDPENLKAIHITNFRAWGIPPNRRDRVVPLIGNGVFTKDGPGWTRSRKLLRPSFERSQLTNVSFLEVHAQDLLSRIPTDGSPVDLQKLFYRFTMHTAAEFLLGDRLGDTQALEDEFEAAFDRCLKKIGGAGSFMSFVKKADPQYERDRKLVHGMFFFGPFREAHRFSTLN
jgi:cytochrome P450